MITQKQYLQEKVLYLNPNDSISDISDMTVSELKGYIEVLEEWE